MKTIEILKLYLANNYPTFDLDLASSSRLEIEGNWEKAGDRSKYIGKKLLALQHASFAIDYYLKASDLFLRATRFQKAINCELVIFEIHKLSNNLIGMASTYEKIASYNAYYLLNNETAAAYYLKSARLHEDNQNYSAAFKKAKFACECLLESRNTRSKVAANSLAFRTASKAGFHERAGIYAKFWLNLIPTDYSASYISVCVRGYKAFMSASRNSDALSFIDEIIKAHFDHNQIQTQILKLLFTAQRFFIDENKSINTDYNVKILSELSALPQQQVKYCMEFKSYCEGLGLIDLADLFYLQEKNLILASSKKTKDYFKIFNYTIWRLSSDYGTSLKRWFICSATIIVIFGLFFAQYDIGLTGQPWIDTTLMTIKPSVKITGVDSWFSSFYYSTITFTTLGYGDIIPSDTAGQIFSVLEVLGGYIMLGGLISIFAKKIIR
jgi:tetratricopeptide (TPR) repeat protein